MTLLYKQLDFPAVPGSLIPDINQPGSDKLIWSNKPRTATRGSEIVEHSRYNRFDISTNLKNWVDTNITVDYKNIGLSHMWGAAVNLPHTDHTRDVTMLYLFCTGGEKVETKFWKRKGYPIHHDNKDKNYHYNYNQPNTYDDLELLDSVVLELHRWYILDAQCIHSVEGMSDSRISLQLGFLRQSPWAQHIFGENY
jgi:hypothetical protein